MKDNPQLLPQKWINTPFAFTRFSKNLSLLQQDILIKVSVRLQPYIKQFFGTDLCRSTKRPKSLFLEAVKNSDAMRFVISYADLGVPANNFYAAREAARKILKLTINAPGVNEENKPVMCDYNIFSSSETAAQADRVVLTLNKDVVEYVFDMAERCVSHPDNIAFLGKVDRMPMIYYLLRSSCGNKWKPEVKLNVSEIKEYIGMVEYVDGVKVKEVYKKFSQFKKYVLDASISDINRLKEEGVLDVCVSYEPVYTSKRTSGNPFFIRFFIYKSIQEMNADALRRKGSSDNPILASLFEQAKPKEAEEPVGAVEWKKFCQIYTGKLALYLEGCTFVQMRNNETDNEKCVQLQSTDALAECFKNAFKEATPEEQKEFTDKLNEAFNGWVRIFFKH